MTATNATAYHVTTAATVHYEHRSVDKGPADWTVTADDLTTGKYKMETPEDAAARIARHRHLDRLEVTHHDGTIEVDTVSVKATR